MLIRSIERWWQGLKFACVLSHWMPSWDRIRSAMATRITGCCSTSQVPILYLGHQDWRLVPHHQKAARPPTEVFLRPVKLFSITFLFNLIVNQVVFVLLTYSLLQWYLLRSGRQLNPKTRTRLWTCSDPQLSHLVLLLPSLCGMH